MKSWLVGMAGMVGAVVGVTAQTPQVIPVLPMATAPVIDGLVAEWPKDGWVKVKVSPAVTGAEREKFGLDPEDRNVTGTLQVEMRAAASNGRFFVALRWPDESADLEYKGWEWLGGKYVEGKKRDDALALRFHLSGDFDRSMLSAKNYLADVWYWSSARTNPSGFAEDWTHQLSVRPLESAAEYEVKGVGTVYIKKTRDAGNGIYKLLPRPKEKGADRVASFELIPSPSGSVADVQARGKWAAGKWTLEMARKLDVNRAEDVTFTAGKKVLGQIAVFNRGGDENKSVSDPLWFDFSALK